MRAANKVRAEAIHDRSFVFAVCVFLVGIVFVVFWQTLGSQFVNYDDNDYVYENSHVTNGLTLGGIGWAFTHFHAANWHPLTTISHMLDVQLYGLSPWGHHLTNVILHALAAILLFLALRRLTVAGIGDAGRDQRSRLQNIWPSAFVAALFAVHPLHVESVAWISERKDVLSGVFFMLTILAYADYVRAERRRTWRYLLVLVLFALGLMCKPTLVTVPFVLLLLDYWPLQRMRGAWSKEPGASKGQRGKREKNRSAFQSFNVSAFARLVFEKLPLFLLSAVSSVITVLAQRGALAENADLGFSERVMNGLIAYCTYLRQTVFPSGLAVVYPYPQGQLNSGEALLAGILLLTLTLVFFWQRRKRPFLIVGWLWFLGMLVPMIGIIQVGSQPHADRYTYLAQIGLFCIFGWLAFQLIANSQKYRTACYATALILIAALGARSYAQCRYWHDSTSLWEHAIAAADGNYVAYNSFGDVLMDKGQLDDAIKYYRKAVELRPGYAQAQSNLGNLLLRKGQTDEALSHLEKALKFAEGFNNVASGYMQKGKIEEAITYYQRAIEIDPNYAEAHNNLGVALLQNGRIEEAITHYQEAIHLKPNSAEFQCNLGNAWTRKNAWTDAIAAYQAAIQAKPDYAKAHNNLGATLEMIGKNDDALAQFDQALQINRNYPEAHYNFGRISAKLGRNDDAAAHLSEALRLRPNYPEAQKALESVSKAASH